MSVDNILFITLSNIGDVILTLPVLDFLRQRHPEAKTTVLVGERPKEIFENNPNIDKLIIYNKHSKLKDKIKLLNYLKKENFDMVVDLRNSLFAVLLPARYKTNPFLRIPEKISHMRNRHMYKLSAIGHKPSDRKSAIIPGSSIHIDSCDEDYIRKTLRENKIFENDRIVIIAPGARSHIKRWPKEKFVELINGLIKEFAVKVVLIGDKEDVAINSYITSNLMHSVLDLSGKTTISCLSYLLKKAELVITNDSAVLHLASYVNRPIVAIFGPTDDKKYGPWSEISAVVRKEISCSPCERAQCAFNALYCMRLIKTEDVLRQARSILNNENRKPTCHELNRGRTDGSTTLTIGTERSRSAENREDYKRILITRTDRIGDVLLSTPTIKAVRDAYPSSFIAMIVTTYTKDIVENNPNLDKIIIYDKTGEQKSWYQSYRFAQDLKKMKFDLAIILHPTNRMHLITFFAGIPKRVGFNRKLSFLLTDRLEHTKQYGERHELEYTLDFVKYLNIQPKDKNLFMPIREESEKWVQELLEKEGIDKFDRLLVIHPGASCPSKVWPNERFAKLSDTLIEKYGFKVLIVAGPKDMGLAKGVALGMNYPAINLAGKTSVSQLASLLKRSELFISNDSGPVHIASAVGASVISIFGRNQKGLSPKRWHPVGKKDKVIHKEVGCKECLAHNCVRNFACLKAINVEDVLKVAESILSNGGEAEAIQK